MQSPFWGTIAIIIADDDSDGWYDHVIGPIVSQSNTPDGNFTGPVLCGSGAGAAYQGRCGSGPRPPLMVISPFAKVNYIDHAVTDQSSILRFIEDNWSLGRIGDNSMDAVAGSLMGMFRFQSAAARAVLLDPTSGQPQATGNVTKAVANPKSLITGWIEVQLDGTQSTTGVGGQLTYQWTVSPMGKQAVITGANTATPFVILNSGPGTYTFVLAVTDTSGVQSSDNAAMILQ